MSELRTITRDEALTAIADGHAIYSVDYGRAVMDALAVPWRDNLKYRAVSDKPGTFKGATFAPGAEGSEVADALSLGSAACSFYKLSPDSKFGRGSQGGAYARALREYFANLEKFHADGIQYAADHADT